MKNLGNSEWITIDQSCELLGVSKPTLRTRLRLTTVRENRQKGRIYLSKIDLIEKVMVPSRLILPACEVSERRCDLDQLQIGASVYDFRNISSIDGFGAVTLLCKLRAEAAKQSDAKIYLVTNGSASCEYMWKVGFFTELQRGLSNFVFKPASNISNSLLPPDSIVPITLIGYKGAEKRLIEELFGKLKKQGFSESLCANLGWALGELADNVHTHSGGPCYFTIYSENTTNAGASKFLYFMIADNGCGISESLRFNPRYSALVPKIALFTAFKSNVTGRINELKRGKGLSDMLSIAWGNDSWLKVFSGEDAIFFDFRSALPSATLINIVPTVGTRILLKLVDATFNQITRNQVNEMLIEEIKNYD